MSDSGERENKQQKGPRVDPNLVKKELVRMQDHKCVSCTGILMALDATKPPTCIGYQNAETRRQFTAEKMNALDKEMKKVKPGELSYVAVGYSQYPRKTTRAGGIPIANPPYGLLVAMQFVKPEMNAHREGEKMPLNWNGDEEKAMTATTAATAAVAFSHKAFTKQYNSMVALYRKTAPNFPKKMYNSCRKLGSSCVRTVGVCRKVVYKMVNNLSNSF